MPLYSDHLTSFPVTEPQLDGHGMVLLACWTTAQIRLIFALMPAGG